MLVLLALTLAFSTMGVTAFACANCRADSRALPMSRTGIVQNTTSGVLLRVCHNTNSSSDTLALKNVWCGNAHLS